MLAIEAWVQALNLRNLAKRYAPDSVRQGIQALRSRFEPPLVEEVNLHSYRAKPDPSKVPRVSLVIPSISSRAAFGGVLTGIDLLLEMGHRAGAEIRVILDELTPERDDSVLIKAAHAHGIDPTSIEVVARREVHPELEVRCSDVFIAFNWWTSLNIRHVIKQQSKLFQQKPFPYLYLVQDYEPQFYPFSSTHMMARMALDGATPYWAVFNASELKSYCLSQGHRPERTFVFEPRMSDSLRPYRDLTGVVKKRRILVYGRPSIPRNCFPAIRQGLSRWIESTPDHHSWDIVSAGSPHKPVPLTQGRTIRSVGKLSLEDYGRFLQETAVGLSLMASPHPSYPPLEMAHVGVLTITNQYANKDLAPAHDNILSLGDIAPETIGRALQDACSRFQQQPDGGVHAQSHIPWFLRAERFECMDDLVADLTSRMWASRTA